MAPTAKESSIWSDFRQWLRRFLRHRAAEFVVVGTGAYFASHTLARLSGTALWVPSQWRDAIDVIGGVLGGAVFVCVRYLVDLYNPPLPLPELNEKKSAQAKQEREQAQKKWEAKSRRKKKKDIKLLYYGISFILSTAIALGGFMWLRSTCLVPFDSRDWLAKQRQQNSIDAERDKLIPAFSLPQSGATAQPASTRLTLIPLKAPKPDATSFDSGEKARKSASTQPDLDANTIDPDSAAYIPWFVDLKSQQVYMPVPWLYPDSLKEYLKNLSTQEDSEPPLGYILAHEPDHLFDILEQEAGFGLTVTNWCFMALDFAILALFACGLACSFDIPSAVGDALGQ